MLAAGARSHVTEAQLLDRQVALVLQQTLVRPGLAVARVAVAPLGPVGARPQQSAGALTVDGHKVDGEGGGEEEKREGVLKCKGIFTEGINQLITIWKSGIGEFGQHPEDYGSLCQPSTHLS